MPKELLLFTTSDCPACGPAKAIARKAAASAGLTLCERDAQSFPQQAKLYNVQSVPTLVLLSPDKPPRTTTRLKSVATLEVWIRGE